MTGQRVAESSFESRKGTAVPVNIERGKDEDVLDISFLQQDLTELYPSESDTMLARDLREWNKTRSSLPPSRTLRMAVEDKR